MPYSSIETSRLVSANDSSKPSIIAAIVAESALPSHCSRLLRITINCSAVQSGAFFFNQAMALLRRVLSSGLSIPIALNSATAQLGALKGPVFTGGGGGGSSLPFLPGLGAGAGSACAVCVLGGSAFAAGDAGGAGAAAFAGGAAGVAGAAAPPLAGAFAAAFGVGRAAGIAVCVSPALGAAGGAADVDEFAGAVVGAVVVAGAGAGAAVWACTLFRYSVISSSASLDMLVAR